MKSYELKPTYENLLDTLLKDSIGRNQDVISFAKILNEIDDACSIALDGNWGSGKTFFVKQTKMLIDASNKYTNFIKDEDKATINTVKSSDMELEPQVCVYYDAWENDNDENPILSLIYSILKNISTDFPDIEKSDYIEKAVTVLEFFTDKNWTKIIESFRGEDPLKNIKKEKFIEDRIKEFLDSLLLERGNRLVVFIDELDRCNPSFAIKLLERIKHYFSNERITFVFSINTAELQHTIKRYYGNDFDACRYLERFFDLRISLPPVDKSLIYRNMELNDNYWLYDSVCTAVIEKYNFSLREIGKYIRLVRVAAHKPTHSDGYSFDFPNERATRFCLLYIVPIMIGLKISNLNLYNSFVYGNEHSPLLIIAECFGEERFIELLSKEETFYSDEQEKSVVTIEDKLKEVYNALFNYNYSTGNHQKKVGNLSFSRHTKEELMRTVGLLSKYADFNIS